MEFLQTRKFQNNVTPRQFISLRVGLALFAIKAKRKFPSMIFLRVQLRDGFGILAHGKM